MPIVIYKSLHVLGLAMLLMALAGYALHAMAGGTRDDNPRRGLLAAFHGIGLLLLIVAGFGMLARIGMHGGLPPWIIGKTVIWLLLGAAPAIVGRRPGLGRATWFLVPLLIALAAYLAASHLGG